VRALSANAHGYAGATSRTPRRTTGATNVTRINEAKQRTIELSQTRCRRGSKMQQHAFGSEIDFKSGSRKRGMKNRASNNGS